MTVADLIVSVALGAGVPAVVGVLWRIGSKVEVLTARVADLAARVDHLERGGVR